MKILHVITSLEMGGAEMLMTELLPRIKDMGIEVDLLSFNGKITPLRKKIESKGIQVFDFGEKTNPYSPLNFFKFRKIAKNYDIIHTHNTACQFLGALLPRVKDRSLITTEHCTTNRRRKFKCLKFLDKWMYTRYERVICISDAVKDALQSHIQAPESKIQIINNGIDISRFSHASVEKSLDDEFGCRVALIQVAGFRYEKDQVTCIRALQYLPDDVHLFLVGDGPLKDQCRQVAMELGVQGRVHFLGVRNDVPQLLTASDIVLVSSHIEGFSLAAVEGMAAAKPVLVSDVPGVAAVVTPGAILFEQGNAMQLAEYISELIENESFYREVASRCSRRARNFDISKMVEGYVNIYRELKES